MKHFLKYLRFHALQPRDRQDWFYFAVGVLMASWLFVNCAIEVIRRVVS